jgi:hypothetical protein
LGIPYEVFRKVATDRGKTNLLQHELIEQFRQARGYVFDWGWIVERLSTIEMEDGTGIQPVASFGVLPICLYTEKNFGTVRDYWNRVLNPYVYQEGRNLPKKILEYFDYFNDFMIGPGEPYEIFAIKAECDGCVYGTRRWLASHFLPIVMPAFVRWVQNREHRLDLLFTLFEQLYAQTYPKQAARQLRRKARRG